MVYICRKCGLNGAGIPAKQRCPNCKSELEIKIRSAGEDRMDGDYLTITAAASEVIHIVKTFANSRCQLYVAPDVDEFLKNFFPHELSNYIVDYKLKDFQMNVR